MVLLVAFLAGLLVLVESSEKAVHSNPRGFLSQYLPSGSDATRIPFDQYDKFVVPNRPHPATGESHVVKAISDMGDKSFTIVSDKPFHATSQAQNSMGFRAAREESLLSAKDFELANRDGREEAEDVQTLLTNSNGNTPIALSAIGVGLLSLLAMLGVRIWRGLQSSSVLASRGAFEADMVMIMAPDQGDNVTEMKSQSLDINSAAPLEMPHTSLETWQLAPGWGQLAPENSLPHRRYATPPGKETEPWSKYPVAIVGGGSSGSCAAESSVQEPNIETYIIEWKIDDAKPCGGEISLSMVDEFDLPSGIIEHKVRKMEMISPSDRMMCSREVMDGYHGDRTVEYGAIPINAIVTKVETPKDKEGHYTIRYRRNDLGHKAPEETLEVDVVIGADGASKAMNGSTRLLTQKDFEEMYIKAHDKLYFPSYTVLDILQMVFYSNKAARIIVTITTPASITEEATRRNAETANIPGAGVIALAPKSLQILWARNWARLAILGCATVYGTNFAAVKQLDHSLPPSLSASLRFGLASMASMTVLWDVRDWDWDSPELKSLQVASIEVGTANALGYVAQSVGLEDVDASLSAFVCSLAVIVVPVLDAVVDRKTISAKTWQGAILAAAGVAMLSSHSMGHSVDGSHGAVRGLLFTLMQPLAFGYGFWRVEKALAAVPKGIDLTKASLASGAMQLLTVKAVADIWLLSDQWGAAADAFPDAVALLAEPPAVFGAVAWTGLVTTFGSTLVETMALSEISAQESTVLFSTEPLWGAGFASLALGERIDAYSAAGGAMIIVACLLASGGFDGDGGEGGDGELVPASQ
jgi:drug/metabolite transporter (DMT)-like permease